MRFRRTLVVATMAAAVLGTTLIGGAQSASAWTCPASVPGLSSTTYTHPFASSYGGVFVSQGDGFCGARSPAHSGVDWKDGGQSVPIYAPAGGVVTHIDYHACDGNYITIKTAEPVTTAFAHVTPSKTMVVTGQGVAGTTMIGYSGDTGDAGCGITGRHVHISQTSLWAAGGWDSANTAFFNPKTYMRQQGVVWQGNE